MNNKNIKSGYQHYQPTLVGKIALAITAPTAIIAFVSVMIALFFIPDALIVTLITFVISFVGGIVMMADIVVFNYKQKKKSPKSNEPKEMDIVRIVHMLIGIVVGIVIGYLIWGAKYK